MMGTLTKNFYSRKGGTHMNMTDYLKVACPMRLAEYEVRLPLPKP